MRKKWIFLISITLIGFLIDLCTKQLAYLRLSPVHPIMVINPYFQLHLAFNKGALFGINPTAWIPGISANYFFYLFSAVAVAFLLLFYQSEEAASVLIRLGVALITSGAIGNLFDRIIHPEQGVIDFIKIDLHFWPCNPWPTFNCADIFITCGIILIFFDMALQQIKKKEGSSR